MASSSRLSILAFIVLVLATSKTEAQLGGLGGLLGGLLPAGLVHIKGTVFCTLDGNMGVNGTATPVFPNALVQLQCAGNVVSTTTTNSRGTFSILLDPLQSLLSPLLTSCSIVVKTPLSNCNINLPSVGGLLSSTLQFAGNIIRGPLSIVNFVLAGFQLLPRV